MNDTNLNRDSTSPPITVRDDDQRLLPLTPQTQIWPNSPISYMSQGNTIGDTSPSPGTYYTTINSTCSRRYEAKVFATELGIPFES